MIAQLSDLHVGGPHPGSGEHFSQAIAEINAMTRRPDLVLITGDLTEGDTPAEWDEFLDAHFCAGGAVGRDSRKSRSPSRRVRRSPRRDAGPLRLVLLDTSSDVFGADDATWLDAELTAHPDLPTAIAIHQPPFETGIWWMDCVGLDGAERFEDVVRKHHHVTNVFSGHVHRLIHTQWGPCSLWVCPSTAVSVAADLDPMHAPAETAEAPTFSLHVFTGRSFVSHLIPVGPAAGRTRIASAAPEFVAWVTGVQARRQSDFA